MTVTLKELMLAEQSADRLWFCAAYQDWLQELAGEVVVPVTEGDMAVRELIAAGNRRVFLIDSEQRYAGFAVIELCRSPGRVSASLVTRPLDYRLVDFFVAPWARRLGVGTEGARLLLSRFRGTWDICALQDDQEAIRFWRVVIDRLTDGAYVETCAAGRVCQRFQN